MDPKIWDTNSLQAAEVVSNPLLETDKIDLSGFGVLDVTCNLLSQRPRRSSRMTAVDLVITTHIEGG